MTKTYLTHFMPLISFDTSWKHQKIRGFLVFSGEVSKDISGMKWVNVYLEIQSKSSLNTLHQAYVWQQGVWTIMTEKQKQN